MEISCPERILSVMKCSELIDILNELANPKYAESWDNVGLLVGDEGKDINKVFIAVDATDEVIDEAAAAGADMLITHHPLLFNGLKHVTEDDFIGRRVIKLIKNDMCCFAMHTNFDVMGMGDEAGDMLDIINREVLQVTYEDDISREGLGRVGMLKDRMTLNELCQFVKERFSLEGVKVFGDLDGLMCKAAIMPGSGHSKVNGISTVDACIASGADVLITGDIDHHDGIDAVAKGLDIIDAGHFGIEKIFIKYMKNYLERNAGELIIDFDTKEEPFRII